MTEMFPIFLSVICKINSQGQSTPKNYFNLFHSTNPIKIWSLWISRHKKENMQKDTILDMLFCQAFKNDNKILRAIR